METLPHDASAEHRAAVEAARQRLAALGHRDARVTAEDEDHPGVDVLTSHVVARVDTAGAKTGLDGMRAIAGAAAVHHKIGCVFSAAGFTDEAIAWADRVGLAMFLFDRDGDPEPVGRIAADALARSVAGANAFGTGDLADPIELAALLAEGLVSGSVGEVSLWSGGAGQVLTLWPEPGDRDTAASVLLNLYPAAFGDPSIDPGAGWQRSRRRIPGGGREDVWTRRCAHANQPPTAVAGEALAHARTALAACGAELEHCRVELRPAPERDDLAAVDVETARRSVFGTLGLQEPWETESGHLADAAGVVALLVDRAQRLPEGEGEAEVVGLAEHGEVAWRLIGRRGGGRWRARPRWQVEARIRGDLLRAGDHHRWLRPARVTVAATTWELDDGEWRTTVEGTDLEASTHQAVADLAVAYTVRGEPDPHARTDMPM